ncbi:MAG TPA: TIGR02281 family clan AA aspartic protease [Burkholderiales bacterium]|nr:TIGR02281 family clan AA aspartic protease [Burkholderiales bacterium]
MRFGAANITRVLLGLSVLCAPAWAVDVSVVALFPGKAMLVMDKGKPRTLRVGETFADVTLIGATSEEAIVSINGRQQRLHIGEGVYSALSVQSEHATVVLSADRDGHFVSSGSINGASVRFLVDTGATMVSMSVDEARHAGVNYLAGKRGYSQTANGVTPIYKVKLDQVTLGDITLRDIDGMVHENGGFPVVLLGMSFLGKLEMRREGDSLTLTKRY